MPGVDRVANILFVYSPVANLKVTSILGAFL